MLTITQLLVFSASESLTTSAGVSNNLDSGCSACVSGDQTWCPKDGQCHDVGSVFNPCSSSQCISVSKLSSCSCKSCTDSKCIMQPTNTLSSMFEAMEHLIAGPEAQFDQVQYSRLTKCMASVDPSGSLLAAHNSAWDSFVKYFDTNGTSTDRWGACGIDRGCHRYMELNKTALDFIPAGNDPADPGPANISIYEPCNYVSNFAYYRVVPSICEHTGWAIPSDVQKALIQGFAALGMGSAFWHGSHTYLGNVCDNRFIDVISFLMHETSVANLPTTSPIIHGLNKTARRPGVNSTQQLTDMFAKVPVDQWLPAIDAALDMPDYMTTFSAIISTWLTLVLPADLVTTIVRLLTEAFGLDQPAIDFIMNDYLPELRNATKGIKLDSFEKLSIGLKGSGTVLKLVYAFMWQEWVFPSPIFKKPGVNELGAALMPSVNTLANMMTGFVHTDKDFQSATNVYPGDKRCRVQEPHSKWHEESANGLADLVFLADAIHSLTKSKLEKKTNWLATTCNIDGWWDAAKSVWLW